MDANDLEYVEAIVTNVSEVQMAVDTLLERVDAIFVPNDSLVQTAMIVVADSVAEMGVPVERDYLQAVLTETVTGPDMEHIPYRVTEDMVFEAMKAVEKL